MESCIAYSTPYQPEIFGSRASIAIPKIGAFLFSEPNLSVQYQINDQHALILYNSHDRPGAEHEAKELDEAFAAIGFDRMHCQWNSTHELLSTMREAVQALPSTALLVVVCVMSHGRQGGLTDREGVQVPVNYILNQLTQDLPDGIPLVSVWLFSIDTNKWKEKQLLL